MSLDGKKIEILQGMMSDLASGIDPTSGIRFDKDTILNNVILQSAFSLTSEILKDYIRLSCFDTPKTRYTCKAPFHLFPHETDEICLSEVPITVSHLTHLINQTGQRRNMRKLRAVEVTQWLVHEGYLEIIVDDETNPYKKPTAQGENLGISFELKTNSAGLPYSVNYYSISAQKLVVSKINDISGYSSVFELVD